MNKKYFIFIVFMAVFACSTTKNIHEKLTQDSYKILESNLYFLASDELEGRDAASQGEKVAGQFIATQLKQYGVEPYGDNGTYFQNFELQKSTIFPTSKLTIISGSERNDLEMEKQFIPFRGGDSIEGAELIYMGYGISDPSIEYDDYKDIDVKEKVVVCMYGSPKKKGDPSFYKETAKFAGSSNKADIAVGKGAKGILILQSLRNIKRWQSLIRYVKGENMGQISPSNQKINAAWIDTLTAKNLFLLPNLTYKELRDTLNSGFIKNGTILKAKASIKIDHNIKYVPARNVVGIIEGQNPSLADEIITIGAHYDHLGVKDGQIYNGADDNGSGSVTILESARQISTLKTNNRPVVFIFYTSEEKGLLGSEYFANNSEHINNIIANINIDMVGRESEDTLFVVGSGKISSELYDIVELENMNNTKFYFDYTYDDENNPERIYYRSDHWNFAEKGIPIVFLTDMHKADYHKPTDTPEKINYKKMVKVADLTTKIALDIANLDHTLTRDRLNISGK